MSPHQDSPFELRAGRAMLRVRHLQNQSVQFEAWRIAPDTDSEELVGVFRCALDDARSVPKGGAVVVTVDDGHLMMRRYEDNIWFVYGVPSQRCDESCMVPLSAYESAVGNTATENAVTLQILDRI